jgi:prepilin-type N-terminal cleavage/methylation domain-containing protein
VKPSRAAQVCLQEGPRTRTSREVRGFTLIEVLVALVMVAVALGAGIKAAGALMKSIRPSLECRVRWRTPNEKWRNAHSLIVALGDIDRILSPDSEDHGSRLEVAALRLRSVWQMFAFGAAFVSGAWRNSKNLKIVRAREVEIIVPSKRPLIVLDGEPVRVSRVGTVTLERRALPGR